MRKVIHIEKQSKKAQKAYYAKKRNTWDINPITRITPDKKKYNRKAVNAAVRRCSD